MRKLFALVLCGSVALGFVALGTERAEAIPAFKTEFDNLYLKKDPENPKVKELAAEVEKVKCNVCHVGKNKKEKNDYGKALDELLDKKADAKNVPKIIEALEKVGAMPSKAGPTYGDLLKEGKLPCPE